MERGPSGEIRFDVPERKEAMQPQLNTAVEKLSADGLGFGDGSISVQDRLDNPEHAHPLEAETLEKLEEAIHSPRLLVPIEADDDGCGDGRLWGKIKRKVGDAVETMKRSLHRSKIFGGGAVMMTATVIGEGDAEGLTVGQAMSKGIGILRKRKVPFGAHTDNHAHGENCGCGAIDKAPAIVQNVVKYRKQIEATVPLLTDDTEGLGTILDNFVAYAAEIKDQAYAGSEVMDEIMDDTDGEGAVVKELQDAHLEAAIILNLVEGYTVDQGFVVEATDGKAQVFAVDVPRLITLAQKKHPKDEQKQRTAFLSMLVYTLGTAGTLTKGDLPVYVVSGAVEQPVVQEKAA